MTNYFLTAIVLAALVGTFATAPAPEQVSRSVASRAATPDPAVANHAVAGSGALEAHQLPIPLVRTGPALPTAVTSPDVPALEAEVPAQDDLDRTAAQAAIEADGYKGVNVLGKASDGTWRARAQRGATEVQLTVDGTGRVSID